MTTDYDATLRAHHAALVDLNTCLQELKGDEKLQQLRVRFRAACEAEQAVLAAYQTAVAERNRLAVEIANLTTAPS